MPTLYLREPQFTDEVAFLAMTQASKDLHYPWVSPPQTFHEFAEYIKRYQQPSHKSYLIFHESGDIIGVYNISEIVRGSFQSAYLGFYAAKKYAGQGLMKQGLVPVLKEVFNTLALHRIEANIQPANTRSIHLVKNVGFMKEGFSPRYLNINNQWCDHERWAITLEDWQKNSANHDTVTAEI